jgi:hypothetical protein
MVSITHEKMSGWHYTDGRRKEHRPPPPPAAGRRATKSSHTIPYQPPATSIELIFNDE